jgi:N-methylhydantoinase A/oxoprolinase/acetone carboxylase beta subunit
LYGAGSTHEEAGIEVISLSVDAIGRTPKPQLRTYPIEGKDSAHARKAARRAYFTGETRNFLETSIYDYLALKPGNALAGPAIVETPFTSIVVPPGVRAELDEYRNVVVYP